MSAKTCYSHRGRNQVETKHTALSGSEGLDQYLYGNTCTLLPDDNVFGEASPWLFGPVLLTQQVSVLGG